MVIGKIRKFIAEKKLAFNQRRAARKEKEVAEKRAEIGVGGGYVPPMYGRIYGPSMPSKETGLSIFGFILLIVGIAISLFGFLLYAIPLIIFAIMLILIGKGASLGTLLIVLCIIGAIGVFAIWFISKGGLQVTAGPMYQAQQGIQAFFNSLAVKRFFYMLENPFGVSPTAGQYEETKETGPPPNQALDVELTPLTNLVEYDNPSLTFAVKVTNLGNYEIKKVDIRIYSDFPDPIETIDVTHGCLRFDTSLEEKFKDGTCEEGDKTGEYVCHLSEIPPHGSKTLVLSGGYIDMQCAQDAFVSLDPDVPTDFNVVVEAKTYYGTASRLSVERIKKEYGELLLKHQMIRQQPVGAIYLAGTAMAVDIDIGDQPILEGTKTAGLLLSWVKTGKGYLAGKPTFVILTPWDYGECDVKGGEAETKCDEEIDFCGNTIGGNIGKYVEDYVPTMKDIFEWVCEQYQQGKMHVCEVEGMTEEFRTYGCTLNIPEDIPEGANRVTDYITVVGIYPYAVKTSQFIKAYCVEGTCPTQTE